jgi:hypoxanthine-guanine phosphoribosyltransferase
MFFCLFSHNIPAFDPVRQKCIYPQEYDGHFDDLMILREEIIDRTASLAKLIHADYSGRRPVLLCVLKGANPVRSALFLLNNKRKSSVFSLSRFVSNSSTNTC